MFLIFSQRHDFPKPHKFSLPTIVYRFAKQIFTIKDKSARKEKVLKTKNIYSLSYFFKFKK